MSCFGVDFVGGAVVACSVLWYAGAVEAVALTPGGLVDLHADMIGISRVGDFVKPWLSELSLRSGRAMRSVSCDPVLVGRGGRYTNTHH